jgi:hypothetical protein
VPAAPVPSAPPAAPPISCPAATTRVSTADQRTAALAAAAPGDSIALADGTYAGKFVAGRAGTADRSVFRCGGAGAVLDGRPGRRALRPLTGEVTVS